MSRRKLPIGIQTFREIREESYYYVDKTLFGTGHSALQIAEPDRRWRE